MHNSLHLLTDGRPNVVSIYVWSENNWPTTGTTWMIVKLAWN